MSLIRVPPRATARLAAAVATAALVPAFAARADAAPVVSVFPIPGGHVAAPSTQLTFRGVRASELGAITVTGSRSGVHTGRIVADSDGDGASFLPSTRFTRGETVTVSTSLDIAAVNGGTYSFTVATPAGPVRAAAPRSAPRVRGDLMRFFSAPQLFAPAVQVTTLPHGASPGYLFVAPQSGPVQWGPEILGPYGGLIWWKSIPKGETATDFRAQTYRGAPVLTWWQGTVNGGVGSGQDEIYSASYRPVATVRAGNGLRSDLHEFQLTGENTALVTAYYPVYVNASGIRGGSRHELVLDAVAQEVDIPTGLVLYQWDSLDHVPLSASHQPVTRIAGHPWDYFHINGIAENPDGSLLISARNTWAVYDVSHQTGAINWTLGGRSSSFRMGAGTTFAFQHDARLVAGDEVTIFDDGAGPPVIHAQSRGITVRLDYARHVATLVRQDEHRSGVLAEYEGSVERLLDGDDFVGWGGQPFLTEFNARGQTVFDARFVGANSSYRAFRLGWSGMPVTRPSIAARRAGGRLTVYASWNGATRVARWRVIGGSSPAALRPVASAGRADFETAIPVRTGEHSVAVQALDRRGKVLGTSRAVAG